MAGSIVQIRLAHAFNSGAPAPSIPALHRTIRDESGYSRIPASRPFQHNEGMTENIFTRIRQYGLYRESDRWVGGVCAGLAQRFNHDKAVIRALLAASFVLTGAGMVAYAVLWLLLPERRTGESLVERLAHGDFDIQVLAALAVLSISWARGDFFAFGSSWFTSAVASVALVALIVVFIVGLVQRSSVLAASIPQTAPPAWNSQPRSAVPDGSPAYNPPGTTPYEPPLPPYRAPEPRVKRPGGRALGIATGMLALAFAVAVAMFGTPLISGRIALVILGSATLSSGIVIVINALRGWSSGSLGWFAALTAIAALIVAPFSGIGIMRGPIADEYTWQPAASDLSTKFSAGDLTIDLSHLPDQAYSNGVSASLGVGDLTVVIPDDVNVVIDYEVGVGSLESTIPGAIRNLNGFVGDGSFHRIADSNKDTLTLELELGVGSLTLVDASSHAF